MNKRFILIAIVALLFTADLCRAQEAVRELGQPNFRSFMANRVDARGLAQPWGVAIDASRSPNGIWVLDAGNNRVLGWRDVTALRAGAPADKVVGQPNGRSNGCNTGGRSAASLCLIQSFNGFAYEPGLAVDAAGNLFVVDQINYRVLGYRNPFETDGVADLVIGQPGFDAVEPSWGRIGGLFNPHGLAADGHGNLYLSDEIRVLEFDRPFATDALADRVFGQPSLDDRRYPSDPGAADQMAYADGVAVDAQGRLYVADGFMDRVMVWKEPLARQGAADLVFSQGIRTCDYEGCNTKGIAVETDGDVWVGSHEQGRIFGYRSPVQSGDTRPDRVIVAVNSGRVYDPKPTRDTQPMFASGGLAVDSTGTLWLAEVNRVLGFSDPWHGDGRADRLIGQVRKDQLTANLVDRDGLKGPDGIALDLSVHPPHLFVVDSSNNRVLGWSDARGFANGQSADLVLGQPDRWASGCNTGGRSLASLCLAERFNGIAVDPQGTVWVSDAGNARVLGFRSPFATDTVADRVLGGKGCDGGRRAMCYPGGLAVDAAGRLYVADIMNNRVLEFDAPGRNAIADRVLGGDDDPATFFSEDNVTHPGYNIYGGPLAVAKDGGLLVGSAEAVYVFERPLLRPPPHSRKLIDLREIVGTFYLPRGLATDSAGRIYVTTGAHLLRFTSTGDGGVQLGERCVIGYSTGLPERFGRASLCAPEGVAIGPGDELFVSDAGAHRVVVFENP